MFLVLWHIFYMQQVLLIYHSHCAFQCINLSFPKVVKQEERNTSFQLFNTEQYRVLQSLAFGRRIHTPAAKETGSHVNGFQLKGFTQCAVFFFVQTFVNYITLFIIGLSFAGSDVLTRHINRWETRHHAGQHNFPKECDLINLQTQHVTSVKLQCTDIFLRLKCPFDDIADPSVRRAMQRSVMQFSSVDWRSFPTAQQSQLGDCTQPHIPNILKITFRWSISVPVSYYLSTILCDFHPVIRNV